MCEWQCCVLLRDAFAYQPDTFDLNKDSQAAEYWFPCFRNMVKKFAKQAEDSQRNEDATASERAEQFRQAYLAKLNEYEEQKQENAARHIVLGIRELLELSETKLRHFGFPDPWRNQKISENTQAMALLNQRLIDIDEIEDSDARWTELVRGVLAGNMFDWGAEAVANILKTEKDFGLDAALNRIQKRPWLLDSLDEWLRRMRDEPPYKCAVIFVDNSGVDIVLGILPFARELLKNGTKVILCANTAPALNDVTCDELKSILNLADIRKCEVFKQALAAKRLLVYGNGQRGPCLDIRTIPMDLCEAIRYHETDLVVIEGMGRALHTNLNARFSCDSLKLAVIKNQWLAQHLGGDTFAVMCKYEIITKSSENSKNQLTKS